MSAVSAIVAEIAEEQEKLQKQKVIVAKAQDALRRAFREFSAAQEVRDKIDSQIDHLTAALKALGYELDDKGNPMRLS